MEARINSLEDLKKLAEKVQHSLKGGEIIALIGELGAGKTAFTKAFLKAAGIKKTVSSPTFVIMIPYSNSKSRRTYYHMDLYRLNGFADIEALGVTDLWGKAENVFLIEWADKIAENLPKNTIYFNFEIQDNYRRITIKNAPKYFKI